MAGAAEFDVRNSCNPVFSDIVVAEKAVQLGHFLVVNMIETDRLINRCTFKDWKEREDKRFRLDTEAMPRNGCEKKDQDDNKKKAKPHSHIFSLFRGYESVKLKSFTEPHT
jgi:hypothetical protein